LVIIKASLNYLLRETDQMKPSLDPLFEAQLQLKPPEILFSPSLTQNESGGFYEQIEEIIANVYDQSTFISRVAKHLGLANYQVKN
jgi:dynein heavy chain